MQKVRAKFTELKMHIFCHFFCNIFVIFLDFFCTWGFFFSIMSFFMILKIENGLEVYYKYILCFAHFV